MRLVLLLRLLLRLLLWFLILLILARHVVSIQVDAPFRIEERFLSDRKLCNNEGKFKSSSRCFTHTGVHIACDLRKLSRTECMEAVVGVHDYESMLHALESLDRNSSIRRITMHFDMNLSQDEVFYESIGREIDKFLTPRTWWSVVKEPYSWQMSGTEAYPEVIMERYHQLYEPYLHFLSSVQYFNDSTDCKTAPLFLGRSNFVHPGLGAMVKTYFAVHMGNKFSVTNMYISSSNRPNDSTAFITGSDCPHIKNKWNCAFLPLTFCPVPKMIRHCHGSDCVHKLPHTVGYSIVFNESTEYGFPVQVRSGPRWHRVQHLGKAPRTDLQAHWYESSQQLPWVPYRAPFALLNDRYKSDIQVETERWLFTFGFFLRQNAYFRSLVARRIDEMRSAFNFSPTDRCITVHIRRGDRVPDNEIGNLTRAAISANAHGVSQEYAGYAMVNGRVPFAAITLPHILTAAASLVDPEVRTMFVVTDDEQWLREEQERLPNSTRNKWKIVSLPVPSTVELNESTFQGESAHHKAIYHQIRDAGTASGVLLHGSFSASRQCEAFVGHFGSAVSLLLYTAMCFGHNNTMSICPPGINMDHYQPLQLHWTM